MIMSAGSPADLKSGRSKSVIFKLAGPHLPASFLFDRRRSMLARRHGAGAHDGALAPPYLDGS